MENNHKNFDIIDLILQKQAEEFEEKQPETKARLITAENFFLDNGNSGGFAYKADILKLIKRQSKSELIEFDALLGELTEGSRIYAKPLEKIDKDGRPYIWVAIRLKKGERGYKFLTTGNMSSLIGMYQKELIACDLNLEALYKAATN